MTGWTTEGMRWAIHRPWLSQRTQSERGERRSEGEGLKARLRAEKYICSAPEGKKVFPLGTNGGFTLGKVHRPTMNSSFLRQDANVVIIPGTLFAYTVQTLRPPRLSLLQQRHSALEISDRPCSPFVKLCASSLYLLECRNIELANIHTRLSIRHAFANGLPHSHASGRLCFWRCLFYVSRPRLRISGSLSDLCDLASQRSTKCTRRGPSPGRVPGCVDCRPFLHSLPTSRRHGLASAMGGAS